MNSMLKKAGLGIALGATALSMAAPAEAQRYYRHRDNGGAALAAGIAGLAIGAAIASNNDPYRDRYYRDHGYRPDYDGYYYRSHGYYPNDGYYAYHYRSNWDRCRIERRWDRYSRRSVQIRVCY